MTNWLHLAHLKVMMQGPQQRVRSGRSVYGCSSFRFRPNAEIVRPTPTIPVSFCANPSTTMP